jgi:SPP1 gp7 family putative phage head morphogenesis protein
MGYWQERARESREQLDKIEKSSFLRLNSLLNSSIKEINKQIDDFDLENIDERLTSRQRTVLLNRLKKTSEYETRDEYLKQLYREDAKLYQIDRLQQLRADLQIKLSDMTRQQSLELDETLYQSGKIGYNVFKKAAEQKYKITMHAISRATIKALANQTWTGSMNWSERIWKDRAALGVALDKILKRDIIQGRALDKTAREIKNKFQTSTYNAMRLVRTESTHTHEQAAMEFYKETDCSEYEFLAHLDDRTSAICTEKNGIIRKIKDAVVGVNYPPMHPNCRSTTAPVINIKALYRKYGLD